MYRANTGVIIVLDVPYTDGEWVPPPEITLWVWAPVMQSHEPERFYHVRQRPSHKRPFEDDDLGN